MDSDNNSGSMPSSSGGDEDYNNSVSRRSTLNSMFDSFLPQPNFFDQTSNFLQYQQNPTSSMLNLDTVSPPANLIHATSSSMVGSHGQQLRSDHNYIESRPDHHRLHQTNLAVTKTPKKRTRASRRAPTTVLTTDTSNFRQMVQEFTGIPAPPFSGAGLSTYSRRFDLFRSQPVHNMETRGPVFTPSSSDHINKVQQNPHLSLLNSTNTSNNNNMSTNMSTSNYSQIACDLGLPNKSLFNDQPNQILSFQPSFNPSFNVPASGFKSRLVSLNQYDQLEDHRKLNFSSSADHEKLETNVGSREATLDAWNCPPDQ